MSAFLYTMQQVNFLKNKGIDSYAAIVDWMETFDSVSTFDALKIIVENKIDLLEGDNREIIKQKQAIKSKNKQLQ